jgi:hypothetical protein
MRDPVITTDADPRPHWDRRWIYGIALAVLVATHCVLTLQLFGRSAPWRKLINDDPVTSGRHALHLEEGGQGTAGAFDPSGYAGYPRTAVFDAESRPAEWLQLTTGGLPARNYKIGLAVGYGLVPVALWLAAVVVRAGRGVALVTAGLGVLVAWSAPAVEMVEAGDLCIPLTGVLAVLGLTLLGRWHSRPCILAWFGLVAVTTLGWAVQPSPWSVFVALSFAVWALLGRCHCYRWNVGLGLAYAAALALSYPAWGDWLNDWWVRISLAGVMPDVSLRRALAFGLWLAVLPTAWAMTQLIRRLAAQPSAGLIVGSVLFLATAGILARRPSAWDKPAWGPRPLSIGLQSEALGLEAAIRAASAPDARVLWEDLPGRPDLGWTALLPRRLSRPFVGGLDPEGVLEHASCALRAGMLAGRPLTFWSDAELDSFARRYNIGCVVCASAAARDRFNRWANADAVPLADPAANWGVYTIRRPHSYVLKGAATQFEADSRRVTLAEVVPEDGEVVLSLHYQDGWRARPGWVQVERELDPYDPIPFIRLRMPGPVGRVTLTWDR